MEKMAKPFVECYLFADSRHGIWDLVGWIPERKHYVLKHDDGRQVEVKYYEFCPISSAHEEEIEAGDDGKIYTVKQLVEAAGELKWKRPAWTEASPSLSEAHAEAQRPEVPAPRPKPKGGAPVGLPEAVDAKLRVRQLLAPATDRKQMADVAVQILGGDAHDLMMKYNHLDNGRYRMVLGNRMVGVLKSK